MRSSDLCHLVTAPVFHMTEPAWRTMQWRIAARGDFEQWGLVPALPSRHLSGELTPEGVATLLMAAMMPRPNDRGLAEHVRRRFNAEGVKPCRVTGELRYGDALSRCVADPSLARHLDLVELAHDFASARLLWRSLEPSEFMEATDRDEWVRRRDAANSGFGIGALKLCLVPGSAIVEIARAFNRNRSRRVDELHRAPVTYQGD